MKKTMCLFLAFLMTFAASIVIAEDAAVPERLHYKPEGNGDWSYQIQEDGTAMIVWFEESPDQETAEVPADIDGIPVTAIKDHAFFSARVKTVIVPEGITSLGDSVFDHCSLKSISLPASLTWIGSNPFEYSDLEDIQIAKGSDSFQVKNGMLISLKDQRVISAYRSAKGKIVVPEGIRIIGKSAFKGCNKITAFSLPKTLTTIEDYAFQSCYGVTRSLVIPAGVTEIGEGLFFNAMERVVKKNGKSGYAPVPIIIEKGNPVLEMVDDALIDNGTHRLIHYHDPSFTDGSYTVPDGITRIGEYAFASFHKTEIILPESLTEIGRCAFRGCRFAKITIPDSVVKIDHYAFISCSMLESINLPDGLRQIAKNAFQGCTQLGEPDCPENVEFLELKYIWERE